MGGRVRHDRGGHPCGPARTSDARSGGVLPLLGRGYGVVGGLALGVALLTGGALLSQRGWDKWSAVAVLLALALVLATGAGVVQARGMTRLRQRAVREPRDLALTAHIEHNARRALFLRGLIGALTVALLALGAALAS